MAHYEPGSTPYEYCKPVCCCLQGITLFGAARRRNFPNFVVLKNVPHRNSIELAAASIETSALS